MSKTQDEMDREAAEKHSLSEGDNGNAEISFLAGIAHGRENPGVSDDLTTAYLTGFEKGKDHERAKTAKLREALNRIKALTKAHPSKDRELRSRASGVYAIASEALTEFISGQPEEKK